jgi:hypothetical protein
MRNEEVFKKAREIGAAIWLLTVYWAASGPDKWPWFSVLSNSPKYLWPRFALLS